MHANRQPLKWGILVLFFIWPLALLASDRLILHTEEYPPMNFTEKSTGRIIGIAPDIIREMMKRANLDFDMQMQPWKRAYGNALRNPNECVFSTSHLEERDALFEWVEPLSLREWVIFSLPESTIQLSSFEDLKAHTVGGYSGDAKAIYLSKRGVKVETAIREELNPIKLKNNRISLWAADKQMGYILAKQADVRVKPLLTFNTINMSLACNKQTKPEWLMKMREAMASLHADGTASAIEKRYQ